MRIVKVAILACCLAATAGSGLWAQTTAAGGTAPAATVMDAKIIAFELGMNGGLKLDTNSPTVGRLFGMDITISDNFAVGLVSSMAGNTNYTLIKLAYHLNPLVGFDIYVGADAAPATAAGAGVFFSVLKSRPDANLATSLQVHLDYLFDNSAGFAKGDIVLGVVSSFGL